MAKDPEILRFLTTEPFREMLQTYARLKPLAEGPEGPFSEALKKYDFTQAYPLFDQYLSTHDLSTPERSGQRNRRRTRTRWPLPPLSPPCSRPRWSNG